MAWSRPSILIRGPTIEVCLRFKFRGALVKLPVSKSKMKSGLKLAVKLPRYTRLNSFKVWSCKSYTMWWPLIGHHRPPFSRCYSGGDVRDHGCCVDQILAGVFGLEFEMSLEENKKSSRAIHWFMRESVRWDALSPSHDNFIVKKVFSKCDPPHTHPHTHAHTPQMSFSFPLHWAPDPLFDLTLASLCSMLMSRARH